MSYDYSVHYKRFHDETESHSIQMANWLRVYLKNELPADRLSQILDVGCGFGFALRALRMEGFVNTQGIDVSEGQVEIARRSGFNATFVEDTYAYLNQHKCHFDTILLMDVLEHVSAHEQIEFLRLLKETLLPGGRLIITVPNANSLLASRWRYIDHTHHNSFTEHSLYFVLKSAAFTQISMSNEKGLCEFPKKWWSLPQRDALRRWLVRFAWLQVFKAELPDAENVDEISFERNLKAIAFI